MAYDIIDGKEWEEIAKSKASDHPLGNYYIHIHAGYQLKDTNIRVAINILRKCQQLPLFSDRDGDDRQALYEYFSSNKKQVLDAYRKRHGVELKEHQLDEIFRDVLRGVLAGNLKLIDPKSGKVVDFDMKDEKALKESIEKYFLSHVDNFLNFSDQWALTAGLGHGVLRHVLLMKFNVSCSQKLSDYKTVFFMQEGELYVATMLTNIKISPPGCEWGGLREETITLPGSVYTLTKLTDRGYEPQYVISTNSLLGQIYRDELTQLTEEDLKAAEQEEKEKCFNGFHHSLSHLIKILKEKNDALQVKINDDAAKRKAIVFEEVLNEIYELKGEMDTKYQHFLLRLEKMKKVDDQYEPVLPRDLQEMTQFFSQKEKEFYSRIKEAFSTNKNTLTHHRDWMTRWAERIAAVVFFFVSVPYYLAVRENLFHISTNTERMFKGILSASQDKLALPDSTAPALPKQKIS